MPITYRGKSGRLRSGARTVAEIQDWTAEPAGEGALRVRAGECRRDPFWWQNHGGRLVGELDFGRAGLRGPAEIVSDDPLVAVITIEGGA